MKQQTGFTIVELVIVIAIIGILAAITIVSYRGLQARAMTTVIKSDLSANSKLIESWYSEKGKYPTSPAEISDTKIKFSSKPYQYVAYCSSGEEYAIVALKNYESSWVLVGSQRAVQDNSSPSTSSSATACSYADLGTVAYRPWLKSSAGWAPSDIVVN